MRTRNLWRNVTLASLAAVLPGCLAPLPDPVSPVVLTVAGTPQQAVQRAAAVAVGRDLEVVTSDAAAGILRATRRWRNTDTQPLVGCIWPNTIQAEVVLTLNVSALPRGDSVQVRVSTTTLTSVDTPALKTPSEDRCRSTGTLEREVAAALR